MNITEFLKARIAEDEATARSGLTAQRVGRTAATRRLAECAAKRATIADWEDAERTAGSYPTLDAGYALGLEVAIQHLAAAYSDHPDYRQEWRPTN